MFVERLEVLCHKAPARPFHRGQADIEARGNLLIRQPLIGVEQDPDPGQFAGAGFPTLQELLKGRPFFRAEIDMVFLLRQRAPLLVGSGASRYHSLPLLLKTTRTQY